jgi:hypothetical protein
MAIPDDKRTNKWLLLADRVIEERSERPLFQSSSFR